MGYTAIDVLSGVVNNSTISPTRQSEAYQIAQEILKRAPDVSEIYSLSSK